MGKDKTLKEIIEESWNDMKNEIQESKKTYIEGLAMAYSLSWRIALIGILIAGGIYYVFNGLSTPDKEKGYIEQPLERKTCPHHLYKNM